MTTSGPSVWILNHYAVPPDLPGGTRHFDLAERLVQQGCSVTIIASSFSYVTFTEQRLSGSQQWALERHSGVDFVWLRTFPYSRNDWRRFVNNASYMWRAARLGRQVPLSGPSVRPPDVVLGSSVHLFAVLAAWWLARTHRAKFVMEVRDIWPQTLIDAGQLSRWHPVVMLFGWLERFLYRRASHVIYVPPLSAPHLSANGVAANRMSWIPNGTALAPVPPGPLPSRGGPLVATYCGSLGRTNGLDVIIEAAAILARTHPGEVEWRIVGQGAEHDRLKALVLAQGLTNVHLLPPVPKREVPEVLAAADVLILCEQHLPALSKYGGSPNKLYDYLAAAKPIAISSDFIKDDVDAVGFGWRVPPEDAPALAAVLERALMMSPDERARMGRRGRAYAEANYSMDAIVGRLRRVLFDADTLEEAAS